MPKSIATALLFGIKSDTANFTRSAYEPDVNMLTFLNKKVDSKILKTFDFSTIPRRGLKYFKRAFNRIIFDGSALLCHLGKVGYMDIGSIIAEQFLKVRGIYLTIVSCIYRDKLVVFFRSVNDNYHAGEFAEEIFKNFGVGGGHQDMGRAESFIQNLPFPKGKIEEYLHNFLISKIEKK